MHEDLPCFRTGLGQCQEGGRVVRGRVCRDTGARGGSSITALARGERDPPPVGLGLAASSTTSHRSVLPLPTSLRLPCANPEASGVSLGLRKHGVWGGTCGGLRLSCGARLPASAYLHRVRFPRSLCQGHLYLMEWERRAEQGTCGGCASLGVHRLHLPRLATHPTASPTPVSFRGFVVAFPFKPPSEVTTEHM